MSADFRAPILRLHASAAELSDFFAMVGHLDNLRRLPGLTDSLSDPASIKSLTSLMPLLVGTAWRRQCYVFVIMQLYGMHERFIRDLAESLARHLEQVFASYEALPERIRKHHLALTLEHLREMAQASTVDLDMLQDGLNRLSNCLNGLIQLNEQAMSRHTANFRCDMIRTVLSRLDFDLPEAASDSRFESFPPDALDGVYVTAEAVVNDLADRRNEVAHGSDFEIVDIETLRAMAEVVYSFDTWLFRRVAQGQLDDLVRREGVTVGEVNHVWRDEETGVRSVARFLAVELDLKPGDRGYLTSQSVRPCVVREIQVNRVAQTVAKFGPGPFGVNFDVKVSQGDKFVLLGSKWSEAETVLANAASEERTTSFVIT